MSELWDVLDEHGNKTGRLHERGKPMQAGDGHLTVHIWIMNRRGEFLISRRKRGANKWDGLWHTTGGCATAGDDSLTAALREAKEEIGIKLLPEHGQLFLQSSEKHLHDDGTCFFDVWLFRQEVDIASVVCQPEEICDAMWASRDTIREMKADGRFIPQDEAYQYLEELFAYCEKEFP